MDGIQKLLAVVIVSLTALLVIVGIQVIFIIKDLRRALKRLNTLLDDSIIGGGLLRPDKITNIFELIKKKIRKSGDNNIGDVDFPID